MGSVLTRVNRGDTYAGETTLEIMCCPMCGVLYAAPEIMLDKARKDPSIDWCCINGHTLHYPGKTPEQKVQDAKDALAREKARHDQTNASLRATKGVVTKLRKRASAGMCPAGCRRHFDNLDRHMKSQHPDFSEKH